MNETDPRLICLRAGDNVLLLATSCPAGTRLSVDGQEHTLSEALALGHKIAARDIAKGETILKYGFPIGVAQEAIEKGAHVHVHNIASNYTPTYTLPDAT